MIRATLSETEATELLADPEFHWYHRFQLAPGIYTPGSRDVEQLFLDCDLPDIAGLRALDIGTANGAVTFELERRGAVVTTIDYVPDNTFGFSRLKDLFNARAEFLQGSIYDPPTAGPFDLVFFVGVLYHLRHPLHAIDQVRNLTRSGGTAYIQTHVCDAQLSPEAASEPLVRFERHRWAGSGDNWFRPTRRCLIDWCESAGLEVTSVVSHPTDGPPALTLIRGTRMTDPEFMKETDEPPLPLGVGWNRH